MAELILTDEEKASPSYLDWDDASIGRAVRWGAIHLAERKRESDDGGETIRGYSAIVYLIEQMLRMNAEAGEITINGLSISGEIVGDFKLTLEQTKPAGSKAAAKPQISDQK